MKQKFIKKEQEETVEQITQACADELLNKHIYDYGIDILEDRVLADFRDGFKPAQRRILWAARDLKAYPDSKTVKSARIVGDCFTGDTEILDANNRSIKISDLCDMIESNVPVYTFSSKTDGTIVPAKIVKCWIASYVDDIVEVTLDNGETFRCTKDHRILMRDGLYCKAEELALNSSLMPVYLKQIDAGGWTDTSHHDRRMIKDNKTGRFTYVYHVMSRHPDCKQDFGPDSIVHVHHVDFDSLNDYPTNLVRIDSKEHLRIHGRHSLHAFNTDGRLSALNVKMWKDPEYRRKHIAAVVASNYRRTEKFHQDYYKKLKSKLSNDETVFTIYKKVGYDGLLNLLHSNDDILKKYDLSDTKFLDRKYSTGDDLLDGMFVKVALILIELKHFSLPLTIDNVKNIKHSRQYHYVGDAKYIAENYKELIDDMGIKVELPAEKYNYPESIVGNSRKLQLFNSALRILDCIKNAGLTLTAESWKRFIKSKNDLSFDKFMSDNVYSELRPTLYNHKVKSVKFIHLDEKIPVYNIEVDAEEHNFALACGTFAKNCMGKYHPHSSAYGSLVNLVNSDYPVLTGQGNFGDINNGPAADRYTEAKISDIGMKCLECMPVADMVPNYGGDLMEPVVIPSRFPNFFVNECSGIAVGLSCSIPAHNLEEIVEALKMIVKKGKTATVKDLLKYVKGPDYSYGGKLVSSKEELAELYSKGEGQVKYECDYKLEPEGKNWLLTIIGYCPGFVPSSFINKMTDFIRDGQVVYVNDSANKSERVKLEVLIKNKDFFESRIKKMLSKTGNYRFYAIRRNKSTAIDKDVQVDVLVPNMLDLMTEWIEWRKEIESKMTSREIELTSDKIDRLNVKSDAVKHLNVVKDALESEDPVEHILNKLPYLVKKNKIDSKKAEELAAWLMDQKLCSIRKLDLNKIENDLKDYNDKLKELNCDLSDISKVVLRELDKLKVFYKPRMLKVA